MNRKLGWWFSVCLLLLSAPVFAQQAEEQNDSVTSLFERGRHEAGISSGFLISPIGADKNRASVYYTLSGVHFGWMLTDENQSFWLPGNLEVLGEGIGGTAFKGRGNYIAGGTAWLRYNFVEQNWRLVPYIQAGVGAEMTDFDSRLIGQRFNFNLNIGVGMRYFVRRNVSIEAECLYQHLSNAKLSNRDLGINAVGPIIGVSYWF